MSQNMNVSAFADYAQQVFSATRTIVGVNGCTKMSDLTEFEQKYISPVEVAFFGLKEARRLMYKRHPQ